MNVIKKTAFTFAIGTLFSASALFANDALVKKGEEIFNNKDKGNCFACHDANGKTLDGPGTLGPKLQYLSAWPEEVLYDKVWDPTTGNPVTAMPSFGRNGWLSPDEIKAVVAYLKTIE